MKNEKCLICGRGNIVETEEKNHKTVLLGKVITIPLAIVGRCDTCKAVNYALSKDVLDKPDREFGLTIGIKLWNIKSRKGFVCGIYGCSNPPSVKCDHCGCHYCEEHKFVLNLISHSIIK